MAPRIAKTGSIKLMIIVHADDDGVVRIETFSHNDKTTIQISNSGSQIDAEQIEHVFEPFWRGDAARSAIGTHAGLGLSLCKKLADSLGCRIVADSVKDGMFTISLRIRSAHIESSTALLTCKTAVGILTC